MAKKENKEIKKAMKDYEVLTGDAEVKRLAEIRLMSKLEENSALATAREEGTKKGHKIGMQEGLKQGKEEGLKQGKEEGKEEGVKQGQEEEKKKIAKKMISLGINIETIMEVTGLSKSEVKSLKSK